MPAREYSRSPAPGAGEKGEREFIRRLAGLVPPSGGVPFGDDMAAIDPGSDLLWTTDVLMDGVDFNSAEHSWRAIGRKALAVNLSDCAAMGARPLAALAMLVLPAGLARDEALALMSGAAALGEQFACPIRGGDTNSWVHPAVVGFAVIGRPDAGATPIRRDGAAPGDTIFVSGPVGGSLLGRHMTFEPRVELGLELSRSLRPSAMIDISDGLSLDLARILEASGCGAALDVPALERVIHDDARRRSGQTGRTPLDHALGDGEDFELIVCAPAAREAQALALGLQPIGRIVETPGMRLRQADGALEELAPSGWEHAV